MPESASERLQRVLDVCVILSSKLDLSEALTTIMQLAARVVGAETASLLLLDPDTQELYFDVALGLDPEVSKIRLKLGQGIAGTVAKEGKPQIINDVRSDPRWSRTVDKQSGFQTRSILAAPMHIKGRLLGVVEAINHVEGPFTEEDLRLFEAFASQAAIAIDNARLFASLKEEKAKLDTVFARMADAAILSDLNGDIILGNEAARKALTVGGEAPETLKEALGGLKVTPALTAILSSPSPVVQFEAQRQEPKRLVLAGTASLLNFEAVGSQPGWTARLFVFRDVTEARQEDLLKRSFLSLISHKLKTPLSSITGYSQLLLEDAAVKAAESVAKPLAAINTQGRKLTDLVDRLLRFTTIEELDTSSFLRKPFAVDELLTQAVGALKPWLEEQRGVVLLEPGSGLTAFGDPNLVREAVKNLIENAVKFTEKPEKKVAVWAESGDGQVLIHVRDQGRGIPPEDQDRIFDKFYQVEAAFTGQVDGWGLGLPYVKKVAEQHGGAVLLKSKLGEGTTITLRLPKPPGKA